MTREQYADLLDGRYADALRVADPDGCMGSLEQADLLAAVGQDLEECLAEARYDDRCL